MRRPAKILLLILTTAVLQYTGVRAQGTSSPYSIYGLGYLEGNSIGPSKGMGGTSIALMSDRYVNLANPASYTGIDSLLTIFEVGVFGKYSIYSTTQEKQSLINANLKYILMGFRVTPWLAASFGFAPYLSLIHI